MSKPPSKDEQKYLDEAGRLRQWPAKHQDQRLVLAYLSTKFAYHTSYSESDVNEMLKRWRKLPANRDRYRSAETVVGSAKHRAGRAFGSGVVGRALWAGDPSINGRERGEQSALESRG